MNLQQNSICSEQTNYPSTLTLYTGASCDSCDILKFWIYTFFFGSSTYWLWPFVGTLGPKEAVIEAKQSQGTDYRNGSPSVTFTGYQTKVRRFKRIFSTFYLGKYTPFIKHNYFVYRKTIKFLFAYSMRKKIETAQKWSNLAK